MPITFAASSLATLSILLLIFVFLSSGGAASNCRTLVVIDPGHGGKDPGAIGIGGVQEKDVNLEIAKIVQIRLLCHPELRVILTRTEDVYIHPTNRIKEAARLDADVYLSIHANAYCSGEVSGAETFVSKGQAYSSPSYRFAELVQQHLVAETGARDRGVKRAALYIRQAKMPAVLAEVGFLTNPNEAWLLQSLAYQSKIADALVAAILDFLPFETG